MPKLPRAEVGHLVAFHVQVSILMLQHIIVFRQGYNDIPPGDIQAQLGGLLSCPVLESLRILCIILFLSLIVQEYSHFILVIICFMCVNA